jgi:hypothetical protein
VTAPGVGNNAEVGAQVSGKVVEDVRVVADPMNQNR